MPSQPPRSPHRMPHRISRRLFLAGSAAVLTGGAAALSACSDDSSDGADGPGTIV